MPPVRMCRKKKTAETQFLQQLKVRMYNFKKGVDNKSSGTKIPELFYDVRRNLIFNPRQNLSCRFKTVVESSIGDAV
jgi:hypothetical protein